MTQPALQTPVRSEHPAVLTCPDPQERLVGLVPAVDQDHHPVRGSGSETTEGAQLNVGLDPPALLQRLVTFIQKDFIKLEVSLRGRPVEGEAAGGTGSNGQVGDGGGAWWERRISFDPCKRKKDTLFSVG